MSWVYIDIGAFSIIVIMYLHGKLWDGIELDGIRVGGGIDHLIVLIGRIYTPSFWNVEIVQVTIFFEKDHSPDTIQMT